MDKHIVFSKILKRYSDVLCYDIIFIGMSVWEEKDLIKQEKNCSGNKESEQNDITKITKQKFAKNEWEVIGGIKKWTKKCPKCKRLQTYSREDGLVQSIKLNRMCLRCYHDKRIIKGEWKRLCPNCNKEIQYTTKGGWRKAIKGNHLCKNCSGIEIEKHLNGWVRKCPKCNTDIIYKDNRGVWMGNKRNSPCIKCYLIERKTKFSNETRKKIRLGCIKQLKERLFNGGQMKPNYNISSCKYFNNLNKENGWNLQHAENGGEFYIKELGYWVDAYDREKNIVVEYDESYHNRTKQKEKDLNRLNEIKNHLNCKFFRYNEKENELKEY